MGIKIEAGTTEPKPNESDKEKKMISAMFSLKSENQKLTFDLRKKQEECVKIALEKKVLEQKANATAIELKNHENELLHLKAEYAVKMSECNKQLSDLRSQNQTLSARIKQLQNSMIQNHQQNDLQDDSNDDIYEVECIVDDKKIGKVQHYRIRWKGYGPESDTWERESNLQCAAILNDYLKFKQCK